MIHDILIAVAVAVYIHYITNITYINNIRTTYNIQKYNIIYDITHTHTYTYIIYYTILMVKGIPTHGLSISVLIQEVI